MHLWTKNRQPTPIATFMLIVLALCVFSWGLQYKLSLYDPPQSLARQVPVAKLLSKNEQPQITSSSAIALPDHSSQAVPPVATALLLTLFCFPMLTGSAVQAWRLVADQSWKLRLTPRKTFFVRPPPVFA